MSSTWSVRWAQIRLSIGVMCSASRPGSAVLVGLVWKSFLRLDLGLHYLYPWLVFLKAILWHFVESKNGLGWRNLKVPPILILLPWQGYIPVDRVQELLL